MDEARRRTFERALSHWREVFVFARQLVRDRDAAEDLAQEAYLRLHASDAPLDETRPIRTLLFTIVRNLARSRARRRTEDRLEGDADDFAAAGGAPPDLADAREEGVALCDALARLKPSWRAALYLADGLDCSYAEIAGCLGASEDTVRTTLHRARARLRESLARGSLRNDGGRP
jgi:RNA polymerase sigma-70 factor (ECF subfamily)